MKIAYCLPDENWINELRSAAPNDAAHIQQKYICEGLNSRRHSITTMAPRDLENVVYENGRAQVGIAKRSWTAASWFIILSKVFWKAQQIFGIPYLNVFSNLRHEDAYLQILPGHDVVFERNSIYSAAAGRAAARLGIPYILFWDADQVAELEYLGKPLTGGLLRRARMLTLENLHSAYAIICVSEISRDRLASYWQVPMKKIHVIPNGVDLSHFRPDPARRAEMRASLHWSDNPLVIFVGSFYPWHDVCTLLDAFAMVLNSHPAARLLLVGNGSEYSKMSAHAHDLGVDGKVLFTGSIPHEEVAGLIDAADIAVVPVPVMQRPMWLSPMKLFEYMASGKAIVASDLGQIAGVITEGKNGLLVPPGEAGALANSIGRLIADPSLRARLGEGAREDAAHNHSWATVIGKIEDILINSARPNPSLQEKKRTPFPDPEDDKTARQQHHPEL